MSPSRDPDRFARLEALFEEALDLSPEARSAFLREHCADDPALWAEVEALWVEDARAQPGLDGRLLGEVLRSQSVRDSGLPEGPPALPSLPLSIGRFRILGRLGSGGMGTVYLAQQDEPRRRVAVKVLHPGLASARHQRRFRREARLLARLRHPGIAQVYESGWVGGDHGEPYLAMELVEGLSLTEFARTHALDHAARVRLVARLCEAVHHAHEHGVIHRDLKPDNVLVVEGAGSGGEPLPKVLDFGIARAADPQSTLATFQTTQGQVLGTLAFMSPEQASSGEVDRRTDVYALGAILFHLLSGSLPHETAGRSLPVALREIQETDAARLSSVDTRLRGDLDTICARALDSEPERRYATAAALAADLRHFLAHEPIAARPPSTTYRLRKFARRNRILVGGVVSTLIVLLLGTLVSSALAIRANRSARAAVRNENTALRELYRAKIEATRRLASEDPMAAARALAQAPERFRGWEWHYLAAQEGAGEELYAFASEADPRARDLAYGAGDRLLLASANTGDPQRVELMDVERKQVLHSLPLPGALVELRLSRDGRRLAALTRAPSHLCVWDVSDSGGRRAPVLFERPVEAATTLALSPSGAFVVAWAAPSQAPDEQERCAVVFETRSGELLWEAAGDFVGLDLAETPRGWRLAGWRSVEADALTGAKDRNGWFVREGGAETVRAGAAFSGLQAAFDPSGTLLAITQTRDFLGRFHLLDAGTLDSIVPPLALPLALEGASFSSDGAWLALRGSAGGIYLVDALEGTPVRCLPARVLAARFDSSDSHLAGLTPSGVQRWKLRGADALVLDAHAGYLYHAVFSPDGSLLATGGVEPEVRLWDAQTGAAVAHFPFAGDGHVKGLAFSADGTRLVGVRGERNWKVHTVLWELASGAESATELPALADANQSPEWARLNYWSVARGGARFSLGRSINSLVTSASNDGLVGGTVDGFFVLARDEAPSTAPIPHPKTSLALSLDGTRVATGKGLEVRLWERRTNASLATLSGHRGEVLGLEFHPDGTRLASAGRDGIVRIWDVETHQELLQLEGHTSYVHALAFSPDGTQLASASGDGTARIWDACAPDERRRRIARARELRARLAPELEAECEASGDPSAVLARLLESAHFGPDEKQAALRVLIERWATERRE